MIARIALLAMLASSAGFAQAQLKKPPSPEGAWGFLTDKMAYGCKLEGEMRVIKTSDNVFSCNFKATWSCETRLPNFVRTEQSCIATRTGARLVMTSKVEKIAQADPAEMLEAMVQRYAADNFQVTISNNGEDMDGMFRSYSQAPVKFRRKRELIS